MGNLDMSNTNAEGGSTRRRLIAITALAIGLSACGVGYDAQIKEISGQTGREASDAEIREACRILQQNNWDYSASGMSVMSSANTESAVAAASRMTDILAAITTIAGGDTQEYCEGKLNES